MAKAYRRGSAGAILQEQAARQRTLGLLVPKDVPLIPIDAVRAVFGGVDAETIYERVQDGALRWVWNVSAGEGDIPEWRFWTKEISNPSACVTYKLPEVIDAILGPQTEWHGVQIEQLLIVSRPTVH